jgi:predicted cupin superfamily sugar epimerase
MNEQVAQLVADLELLPHPEGGFYKETYRSKGSYSPIGFPGLRNYSTSIYFLLTSESFSSLHRIKQDEVWHFYQGSPLFVHVIDPDGNYAKHAVGLDLKAGQTPQLVVEAGCWFGATVKDEDAYSLVGCTVAPGFDFDDFELAKRTELSQQYPEHQNIIRELTRV